MKRSGVRITGALAALLAFGVLAAQAAPVQWTGNSGGAWVRLFVDGQKATGGVRAQLPELYAEMELSGSGAGKKYAGSLQGRARKDGRAFPLSGSWEADLASASMTYTVRPRARPPRTIRVALVQSAGYQLLKCAWVRGSATRRPKGSGGPISLKTDSAIAIGDSIETGPDSGAVIVLGDRSVVMMQEKTTLSVPDVPENRAGVQKTRVSSGKVWFAVKQVQERGKFEVETDEAVAAVRGTEFEVEVGEEGETAITTAEGEVDITNVARTQPPLSCRAGMRWGLPRRGARAGWGRPQRFDLQNVVRRWRPMLQRADHHWPLRREGKAAFWQDRYFRSSPPDEGDGEQPEAGPGLAAPRRRPGPDRRPARRRGPRGR